MKNFYIIVIIFIAFALCTSLSAQSKSSDLFNAYNDQNFTELQTLFNQLQKTDVSRMEWTFYSALFTTDGEEAKNKFQQVFDESQGQLKKMAAKKIMDYYYAKGYYINAAKYQKYIVDKESEIEDNSISTDNPQNTNEHKEVIADKTNQSEYYIQVGAFSLEDNADQLKKMLLTQNVNALIVKRDVNSRTLYCVWLPGKESFEQTLLYANSIKDKYELKFRIIKQ